MKISFGPFVVDSGRRRLTSDEQQIALSPKAFNLLCLLAERRPNVVDRATLMQALWPDTVVIDANLNVLISEIRAALGDSRAHACIETAHGVGFAFVAAAVDIEPPGRRTPSVAASLRAGGGSRFWLVWNEHTFVLDEGDNILGRDPHCQIWLDESGISRQHARIRVDTAARRAVIEDLGSTNGTSVGQRPVHGPTVLADGDVITIGARELTFRAWIEDKPRATERLRVRGQSRSGI